MRHKCINKGIPDFGIRSGTKVYIGQFNGELGEELVEVL